MIFVFWLYGSTVPGAPTNVAATADNGQATVSFDAPPDDGGSAITSYTVTASPGGITATGAGSPITVTGLTNGVTYTFTVVATNEVGDSAPSSPSNSVTPESVPDPPTNVAATAGDGEATVSFDAPADNGGHPITSYTVTVNPGGMTFTGPASPIVVTGLINGTAYTFTVIATNAKGDSAPSAVSNSVTPSTAPDAPTNVVAVAGDGQATVSFDPPAHDGYSPITQYTVTSDPGGQAATGAGSPITVTGLDNGTAYTFTVVATNAKGDSTPSAASNSVTPGTVPGAPTNVTAVAGNGQAVVNFDPPAHDGYSPITQYTVTANPGGITATGSDSPITVTGLQNGTTYTFTVTAANTFGESAASDPSNSVTPSAPVFIAPGPEPESGPESVPEEEFPLYAEGLEAPVATANRTVVNDRATTSFSLDARRLSEILGETGGNAIITIPVTDESEVVTGELDGRTAAELAEHNATLAIETAFAAYRLPARLIDLEELAGQFGEEADAADIRIVVEVAVSDEETADMLRQSAGREGFEIAVPPVDFTVKGVYGERSVELNSFRAYVERSIALPEDADPGEITTAVVLLPDGRVRHVPTHIMIVDGKYHAVINSLTNSSYALIRHKADFLDMANHWAEAAVEDMGSRMVVEGVEPDRFMPGREATRAELTATIVRALGLKPVEGGSVFRDVADDHPYADEIRTAAAYGLVTGYADGTFRPENRVTRAEALVIAARAMELTGLRERLDVPDTARLLEPYADGGQVPAWARDGIALSLEAGIVSGRSSNQLAPQADVTRAEMAVIACNLLIRSGLI